MNTYLLIDGNAVMHRAYHALPPFKTKNGIPTNVVFGFFSILHKALVDFKPDHLIVCFDVKGPTFRKELYKEYKATRKKPEDDFLVQIPFVKEGLNGAEITYSEKQGFEADDLLGTLSQRLKNKGKVLILSGDKDILQLAHDNTFVITPQIGFSKMKIYDEKAVLEKFGVSPSQMTDYKALAGDQSDNYSGAKGIGPKTATNLIQQFNTIEKMFKKIDEVKSEKIRDILKTNEDNILLAKKLAKIDNNVSFEINFEKTHFDKFPEKFKEFLIKYEIYSLANRFFNPRSQEKKEVTKSKKLKREKEDQNQIGLF